MPDEDDDDDNRWNWFNGNGSSVNCTDRTEDTETEYSTLSAAWVILVIFTVYFWLREILDFVADPRKFISRTDSLGNLAIDILLILCLYKGNPHDKTLFERWQFHVATVTSFLLWVQTMLTLGKYPGYGKYIIMFK